MFVREHKSRKVTKLQLLNKLLPITLLLLFMTSSCSSTDSSESTAYNSLLQRLLSGSVPVITVEELSKTEDEVVVLDARESDEYSVSHIPDAKHIGYNAFSIDEIEHLTKDKKIVVYCSVGYRSEKIGEKLQEAGYSNVKNLYGGIFAWVNQRQPIINETGETDKIHPYGLFWKMWITNSDLTISHKPD